MAQRKAPAVERSTIASRASVLARPFLPTVDLVESREAQFDELTIAEKRQLLATKVADVTHFRVGLDTLHRHARVALDLAADVRPLSRDVRGMLLNPDRAAAVRVSVQPAMPAGGPALGRGVVTDELGVFTLPLPKVTDAQRGETMLGAELTLLYTPAAIARSALAPFTAWLWQGTTFGAPA
jgi:hypothetical protein